MKNEKSKFLVPQCLSALAPFKKSAFTLAEVLITLAIIGVVAAMTIPTLISSYQEKTIVTKLKKAHSTLSQAFMYSVAKYGSPETWGLEREDIELSDYLNIIKTNLFENLKVVSECADNSNRCGFASEYYYIDGVIDNSLSTSDLDLPTFSLADGSSIMINRGGGAFDRGPNALSKVYALIYMDINGKQKPNIYGKDLFVFYLTYRNIMPWGTYEEERNPFSDCSATGRGCTAWVIQNGNMDYLHCSDLSWDDKRKCD